MSSDLHILRLELSARHAHWLERGIAARAPAEDALLTERIAQQMLLLDGSALRQVYDARYIVQLDAGARLVVTRQNLATTSTEALAQQGKAVRLVWKRQHELRIADGSTSSTTEEEAGT